MSTPLSSRTALMRSLARALRDFSDEDFQVMQAVAERLKLPLADFKCLGRLHDAGPMSAGQLAQLTGLTTGSVTAMIDRLERQRLVRRLRDPSDGRRVLVELLPDRGDEVASLMKPLLRDLRALCTDYDGEQVALISDYLNRATKLLRQQAQRIREGS